MPPDDFLHEYDAPGFGRRRPASINSSLRVDRSPYSKEFNSRFCAQYDLFYPCVRPIRLAVRLR